MENEEISPGLAYYRKNREKLKVKMLKRHHANKEENNAKSREYARTNPEIMKACKDRAKAKRYGLTVEEMYALYENNQTCNICGDAFPISKHKHIDHCHATGKARGILCTRCNTALGHMRDSPELLRKAAEYLEKFK